MRKRQPEGGFTGEGISPFRMVRRRLSSTTGSGRISVTLGKVGKVTLNGTLPGTLLLKGAAE